MDEKFLRRMQEALHEQNQIIDDSRMKLILERSEKELSKVQKRQRIGLIEFFIRQIKYLSVPIWCVQGIILFLIVSVLGYVYGELTMTSEKQLAILLSSCVILILLTTIPVIKRSIQYQMSTVEAATRFSVKRILAAKLITIGLGDSAMIAGLMLFTIYQTSLPVIQAVSFLMVPFLILSSVALYLIGHMSVEKYAVGCICASAILFFVVLLSGEIYPGIFEEEFMAGWVIICLALGAFSFSQIRYIMNHSAFAELQIV